MELGKGHIVPTWIAPLPHLPPHGGSTAEGQLQGGRGGGRTAGGPPPEAGTSISEDTYLYICLFRNNFHHLPWTIVTKDPKVNSSSSCLCDICPHHVATLAEAVVAPVIVPCCIPSHPLAQESCWSSCTCSQKSLLRPLQSSLTSWRGSASAPPRSSGESPCEQRRERS